MSTQTLGAMSASATTWAPPVSREGTVVARIANIAAQSGHFTAIVDGEVELTFAELEARASQLAHYLTSIEIGAESTVVLHLDRSADFIVSALAVMKAGGAYVPLDSKTPDDRVAYVLSNSGAQGLISHRGKARGVTLGSAQLVELDGPAQSKIARQPKQAPEVEITPDMLAYIAYTSGSTGRPKGAENSHRNLNCLINWHQTAFNVVPSDRASHVAGLGFDVIQWEIWPNISAGAAIYIADEITRRSPEDLQRWMMDQQITIAFAPTVMADQLLQLDWPADTAIRWMMCGGESLHRRPKLSHPFRFANCYGPAECAVVSTSYEVTAGGSETPTIGRDVPRTRAYVLDENLQPVPAGEAGELCLSGENVGRGYRNNPEITARQFTHFTPAGGKPIRIYRTGDRCRQLDNGEFVFMGRLDDQVKIRGYRIEPGEIAAWLDKLPSVRMSAVVARDCGNGLELVAYIAPAPGQKPTAAELKAYLAAQLPDYMVPARFVSLPTLPVTPNGKIDKANLPAPTPGNTLALDCAAATPIATTPADPLEQQIGGIIAQLLGQSSAKASDNFFMLGGHSMLGVQLVAKIRDTFGVKLTLRQLFSAPTVSALCTEIRKLGSARPAGATRKQ
jgi:amino acid adenylation domain-containing protein